MKLLSVLGLAAADSTVTKVVDLLVELKGKVEADLQAEQVLMEEYSTWCDDEKTKTSYSIKDLKRQISEASATVEGESAKEDKFSSEVSELGPAIAGKESEMSEAKSVRAEENKAFLEKEKELVESEDMLRRAYGVIKRSMTGGSMSLVQQSQQVHGKMKNMNVQDAIKALSVIVEASWIDPTKADKLNKGLASLASAANDDDLSLAQQAPQATVKNYESQSGSILSVVDDLREEVAENLRKVRNSETNSRHQFELLAQSLNNEVTTMSAMLSEAEANQAASTAAKGAAAGDLRVASDSLGADASHLKETSNACGSKAAEWAARQTEAAAEIAALEEAKEVLSNKVSVLMQTNVRRSRVHTDNDDENADNRREKVVTLLRNLGHKYNSFGLLQAASSATADPFAKVRGMIQDMLMKLEQQSREEADHNEMCVKELAKNEKKKQKKQANLAKHNTRFDGAHAKTATLKAQIENLETQLKEMAASVTEATSMRNKEHAENVKVVADNKESAAAVADAIKILREYYGRQEEAFLQAKAPTFEGKKSDSAHSIIEILETAESDFTKLFMETESEEAESAEAYKKFMQSSEVSKAKKEAMIVGKKSEIQSLAVQLSQLKDDIANTEAELEAVITTLATLHKQCDAKAMSYEERKTRREAEIAGLQQALEVLSPEEASLVQTNFLARK